MFSHRILSLALTSVLLIPTTASALTPPSLTQVIEHNELQRQKAQVIQTQIATMSGTRTPIVIQPRALTYSTKISGKAVTLYSYDRVKLWVQEVDLSKGASIDSILQLGKYDEITGEPLYLKKSLKDQKSLIYTPYFSIVNGQFFDPSRSTTTLSLGLKKDGEILSIGADDSNIRHKNILFVGGQTARIAPYSWDTFKNDTSSFAMVNFSLANSHYADERIGRTYICIPNPGADNSGSKLLVWTALAMIESDIEREMIRWGCTRESSAKLDSSGSTRLLVGDEYIYGNAHKGAPDYRTIPHAIVIKDAQ